MSKINYKTERYFAVVETGNCDRDYNAWEEAANCEHAHKTVEAAKKCLKNKQRYYCDHSRPAGTRCKQCLGGLARGQHTSALWSTATIHNQHEQRIGFLIGE